MKNKNIFKHNLKFTILLINLLILSLFFLPLTNADAPTILYDNPNLPKVEYTSPDVAYMNYSTINGNDSKYLEGRDTAALYTYFEGLYDLVYCKLTGCTMTGDIDMSANNIYDIDKTYFSGSDFISSDDNGHIDIHTGWIDMHGNISTIWNIFFTDAVVPGHNKIVMGGGGDSEMYYNSTDFIIDPDVVGTGDVYVLGDLHADYFIGNGSQLTGIESLWATDGTDVWRTTGDVGIGTASPEQQLEVKGTNPQILIQESATEFVRIGVESTPSDMMLGWDDADDMHFGLLSSPTDGSVDTKMIIRRTGNVGIGTLSPSTKFEVGGSESSTRITISNNNAVFNAGIGLKNSSGDFMGGFFGTATDTGFYSVAGSQAFLISRDDGTIDFQKGVDSVKYMTILPNGNVGIGTTTPSEKLEVNGNLNISGNFTGNQIYGGMYYHNHTGTTLTFGDGTWDTLYFSDADKLNGFSYVGGIGLSSNLTAQVAGTYQVHYMAIGSGQNNHIYLSTILIDGVEQEKCGNHHKMAAGGDVITQSGNCIINIAVGEDIQLATQDMSGGGDGDYYGGNINLMRIGD